MKPGLINFVKKNDLIAIQVYIRLEEFGLKKLDLNERDEHGSTPLMWAADLGLVEIAEYLVNQGARIDLQNNDGKTALGYALCPTSASYSGKHQTILEILIEKNTTEIDQIPAIWKAAARNDIPALLNFTEKDFCNSTYLNLNPMEVAVKNGHAEALQIILKKLSSEKTIEVIKQVKKYCSNTNRDLLQHAIAQHINFRRNTRIIKLLLDALGVNAAEEIQKPSSPEHKDSSLLHYSVFQNKPDLLKLLLDKIPKTNKTPALCASLIKCLEPSLIAEVDAIIKYSKANRSLIFQIGAIIWVLKEHFSADTLSTTINYKDQACVYYSLALFEATINHHEISSRMYLGLPREVCLTIQAFIFQEEHKDFSWDFYQDCLMQAKPLNQPNSHYKLILQQISYQPLIKRKSDPEQLLDINAREKVLLIQQCLNAAIVKKATQESSKKNYSFGNFVVANSAVIEKTEVEKPCNDFLLEKPFNDFFTACGEVVNTIDAKKAREIISDLTRTNLNKEDIDQVLAKSLSIK
jgi:ankyrin repeat protein